MLKVKLTIGNVTVICNHFEEATKMAKPFVEKNISVFIQPIEVRKTIPVSIQPIGAQKTIQNPKGSEN